MDLTRLCTLDRLPDAALDMAALDTRLTLERVDICPAHYTSSYTPGSDEIAQVLAQVDQWADMSRQVGDLGIRDKEHAFLQTLWAKRAGLYDYFPYLFADAFPEIDAQVLRDLASSARLCYTAIVLTDRIADQVYATCPRLLLEGNWMYIAATRLLARHFPADSPFWVYFDTYFYEQYRAAALENQNHVGRLSPYPLAEMEEIARGKAALGKFVIAGLGVLSGDLDPLTPLAESYDLYYIGYQFFDDLCDWREDYRKRIYSYLLVQAVERYRSEWRDETAWPSFTQLGHRIGQDLGRAHLQQADVYLERAIEALGGHRCGLWRGMIRETRERIRTLAGDLAEIAAQQVARRQKRRLARRGLLGSGGASATETAAARAAAVGFLLSGQTPQGCWQDFWGAPGASTDWVTGYVGLALAEGSPAPAQPLQVAADWLLAQRRPTGGWGYNQKVLTDLDSTAHCMLFLHALGGRYPYLEADLVTLLTHQDPVGGGFCTYLPDALPDRDNDGWCSPAPSVSAAAILVLQRLAPGRFCREVGWALEYLLAQQTATGFWRAYWWNGVVYSTAMALRAWAAAGPLARDASARATAWLLGVQKADGSWGQEPSNGRGQPFATAMAVRGLLADREPAPETGGAIREAVAWLVENQLEDGSWASYPIMRIPDPDVLTPWAPQTFPAGKMTLAEDSRRVFTTATVLSALAEYTNSIKENAT